MSERAALVERMAEAIEQQFDLGYTATAIDFASVALAAVEAAGWGPRPEPDALPPEVEAALNASLREHRAIYQQLADTPEPDAEARDVLAEAIRITPHGTLGDGPDAYDRTADAGLAALRAKGFAVVRTADVEAARDCARGMALECRGKPRDYYNALAERLKEAIR